MSRSKILRAILIAFPAIVLLVPYTSANVRAATECNTKPGSTTPPGRHWYYRINRADKLHCWYLGSAEIRASARVAASPAAPSPASALRIPAQIAPAPAAPIDPAFAQRPSDDNERQVAFAKRWPDLPKSWDLDRFDGAPISSSFAETGVAMQMPLIWPLIEARGSQHDAAGGDSLQSMPVAVSLVIFFLLLATAVWKLASASRQAAFGVFGAGPVRQSRSDLVPGSPTLTDPAHDLKRSLSELMCDLRRAAAASDTLRPFAPSAGRAGQRARFQTRRNLPAPIEAIMLLKQPEAGKRSLILNAPRPNCRRRAPRPEAVPRATPPGAARPPSPP
jgi:hypothetical protein